MKKQGIINISMDVLSSLSPQRGMLSAAVKDLLDQTFVLHSVVTTDPEKDNSLTETSEDNIFVKARYVNKDNSKSFTIPIRGLLNMDIAQLAKDGDKFDENTETAKMHEYLLEKITGESEIGLPPEFKVVSVVPRVQAGTENVMYPPHCYKAFNKRVEEVRESENYDGTLNAVYSDFDFMQSIYSGEKEARHASAEPTKNVTIVL